MAPELIARQTTRVLSSMSEAQLRRTKAERHWLRPPLPQAGSVPAAVYAAIPDGVSTIGRFCQRSLSSFQAPDDRLTTWLMEIRNRA